MQILHKYFLTVKDNYAILTDIMLYIGCHCITLTPGIFLMDNGWYVLLNRMTESNHQVNLDVRSHPNHHHHQEIPGAASGRILKG